MDSIQSQFQNSLIFKPLSPRTTSQNNKVLVSAATKPDEFVKSSSQNTNTHKDREIGWHWISAAAVALPSLWVLIAKNRYSKSLKLAEHIDFQPAKTVEEAVKFGRKALGIKDYVAFSKSDVEIINYINEGIVNTSNSLKGKIRLPKIISYMDCGDKYLAAVTRQGFFKGVFMLNKTVFGDMDKAIQKTFTELEKENIFTFIGEKNGDFQYSYAKLIDREFINSLIKQVSEYKKGKITTLKDKISLYNSLDSVMNAVNSLAFTPVKYLKQILNVPETQKFCKEHNISLDMNKIKSLPIKEQFNILKNLPLELKQHIVITGDIQDNSPFRTIYHELGHLQDMKPRCLTIADFDHDYNKYPKELKEWVDNEKDLQAAYSVSTYAGYGPGEFVAETFARIISGVKVSDEAKALYKKLGGPTVPLS